MIGARRWGYKEHGLTIANGVTTHVLVNGAMAG